jgi:hypothetical protein
MKKVLFFCLLPFAFCLLSLRANAQTYYQVTTYSGTQSVGGITVTITPIGSVNNNSVCGTGPYFLNGASNNNTYRSFKFVFSSPVYTVRTQFTSIEPTDTVGIKINGAAYAITNANISAYSPCTNYTWVTGYAYNGYLIGPSPNIGVGSAQVDVVPGGVIDSVEVYEAVIGSGFFFNFYFANGCGATPQVSADTPCAGDSLHLGVLVPGSAISYNWSGPNNFSDTLQYPGIANIQSNGAGVYHINITADSCTYHDSVNVSVSPAPSANFSSNSPLCAGDTLHFTGSMQSGVTYNWHGPNNFSDTIYNPSVNNAPLNDSGYYVLSASNAGCSATDSVHVVINPTPASPIATSNSPLCANDTLQFTINNLQLSNTYQWHGPNSFSQSIYDPKIFNVQTNDSGKYIVKATQNGCASKPDTIDVVINPTVTPTVNITSMPAIIPAGHMDTFTAHTTNCSSPAYQWYLNGNKIIGATSSSYIDTLGAGEHISVTVHCAPCASPDSVLSNMLTTTGVSSLQFAVCSLTVWPNPSAGAFNVRSGEAGALQLFDMVGKVVAQYKIQAGETILQLPSTLASGLYMAKFISDAGATQIIKLQKE